MEENIKIKIIFRIILAAILVGCLFSMPYGYYQFVRLACCIGFIHLGYRSEKVLVRIIYYALAILFNPIIPIHFTRKLWNWIDGVLASLLVLSIIIDLLLLFDGWKEKMNSFGFKSRILLKRFSNAGIANEFKSLKILHLDDHLLFSKGLSYVILKKYPNASIEFIQDGDKALKYVFDCIDKKIKLDLIVTDISHPGINGIEFTETLRRKEINCRQKIPVLFVSMHNHSAFIEKIEKIPYSKYLPKSAHSAEIITAIERLL